MYRDRRIHDDWVSRSAASQQCACPFYSLRAGCFGIASHHSGLSAFLLLRFGLLWLMAFPKAKIAVEREEICECDSHTVHKLSQRHLTVDWLPPQESDCSRTDSKFSSDWLPSYIKATWTVLEILKMAGYFPDSPHIHHHAWWMTVPCLELWCAAGRSSLIQSLWSVWRYVPGVWLAPPWQLADPVQA